MLIYPAILLDSVVRKGINANLGLKVKLGFNFSCRRACIRARFFASSQYDSKLTGGKLKKENSFRRALKLN